MNPGPDMKKCWTKLCPPFSSNRMFLVGKKNWIVPFIWKKWKAYISALNLIIPPTHFNKKNTILSVSESTTQPALAGCWPRGCDCLGATHLDHSQGGFTGAGRDEADAGVPPVISRMSSKRMSTFRVINPPDFWDKQVWKIPAFFFLHPFFLNRNMCGSTNCLDLIFFSASLCYINGLSQLLLVLIGFPTGITVPQRARLLDVVLPKFSNCINHPPAGDSAQHCPQPCHGHHHGSCSHCRHAATAARAGAAQDGGATERPGSDVAKSIECRPNRSFEQIFP